ncbi:MAG: DUF3089 domain-containing protein [Raoultibacter sp.]
MSHPTTRFRLPLATSAQHKLHPKRTAARLTATALVTLLCLGVLASCGTAANLGKPLTYVYNPDNLSEHVLYEPIDYADASQWVARPTETPLPVDVIYLYPTSWQKKGADESNLCSIDNESLRATAPLVFEQQATAFETAGNVFAPYYRQADAAFCLGLSDTDQRKVLGGTPLQDVTTALDYYFEHCNQGRPFILAGHSQGSQILNYVLQGYLIGEHPELKDRMVAAYLIGYSVTPNNGIFLGSNAFKFAEKADDTGVVVSYNTEASSIEGPNPIVKENAMNINPITWTRSTETAPASASKGARINGVDVYGIDGGPLADATIDPKRNVVVCSTADPDLFSSKSEVFPKGSYHAQDYAFYYYDLRANAELRAAAYLEQQGTSR